MHKSILVIIPLYLLILASCSHPQANSAPARSVSPTKASTAQIVSTVEPITNTPISTATDPSPVPTQLIETPTNSNIAYPYPGPGQPVRITPFPTSTPSRLPSPTTVKPTPTFPASLISLRIAYIAQGKLWLWNMGISILLTDVDDTTYTVRISDDGKVIVFTRESGLWAIDSDGTRERLLIGVDDFKKMEPTDPGVALSQLDWIPNTHKLIFNTKLLTGYGLSYTDDLYLVNADTQTYTPLLPQGKGGHFIFSPNGKLIALITPSEIRVMGIDGSSYHTVLKYPNVAIPSEFSYYTQPVWASDSKSLMVAIPPADVYYDTTSASTIWHLSTDGSPAVVISTVEAELGQYVYISPDFSKIAVLKFINLGTPSEYTELHIADMDGSNNKLFTGCNREFIGWAQDSERFVCRLGNSYQLGQLGRDAVFLADKGNGFSWISSSYFIYDYGYSGLDEIRLRFIGEPSMTLVGPEAGPIYYDFTK